MTSEGFLEKELAAAMRGLGALWRCPAGSNTDKGMNLAGRKAVEGVLDRLVSILFPGCHGKAPAREGGMGSGLAEELRATACELRGQIRRAFQYQCTIEPCADCDKCGAKAGAAVSDLVAALPEIHAILQQNIVAAYEGDPAARSTMEVVMSYPGVYAVIVHRLAHRLYARGVPLIPRIMSEYAHSRTGIDIHPGARIGAGFFIDHGTGVVIGETTVIGEGVKLYQGVTLGALSFEKDAQGRLVKGIKRHPNVEDGVVIYAGATILGGETTIGAHSEIGGNVWLTHSVPPGSKVYDRQPRPLIRGPEGHWQAWNDMGAGI